MVNVHHVHNCGECVHSLDMKKFGGPGRRKCLKRRNSHKVSNVRICSPSTGDGCEYISDHAYAVKGMVNCMFRSVAYLVTKDDNIKASGCYYRDFENVRITQWYKQTNN